MLLGLAASWSWWCPPTSPRARTSSTSSSTASRYVSIATPWRGISNAVDLLSAPGALRPWVTALALVLGLALGAS